MPSAGKFRRAEGAISRQVEQKGISTAPEVLNAVDFIESHRGLAVRLFPIQRLIVKCVFGVPVDYKEGEVPLHDVFRERLIRTVKESEALHVFHEEGRALGVDEPVPTSNGFSRMGSLQVGDMVLSPDGTSTEVIGVQAPFEADLYRVSFDDGTSVLAHGNHLWETSAKGEKHARYLYGSKNRPARYRLLSVKTTLEVKGTLKTDEGASNHAVRLALPLELPFRKLPIDPYCLGVWLGDGHSLQAIITGEEADCLEILQGFSSAGFGHRRLGKFWWSIYGIFTLLRRGGLLGNKHIPHDYLWSSASQRLALLQGLMDSDGSCSKRGQCEFSNTNRQLSEGVYHLAASLGLKPGWSERPPGRGKRKQTAYRVRWTSPLPVFRLARKLARLPEEGRRPKSKRHYRYITGVEAAGRGMVRCISVRHPSGLFLFGKNFNVTHNCNIGDWRDIPERGYNEACVIAGRRGGKSQLVSAMAAYKLYMLLNRRSPQEWFGLVPNSHIDFTFLAQDDDGAARLYDKLREDVNRAPFFKPYLKAASASWLGFVTESDRDKPDVTPTINVESHPCTTSSVRSPSSIMLALDEFAHFRSEVGSTSDAVYEAATPSTLNFHHAETDGGMWVSQEQMKHLEPGRYREFQDSLIVSISSPWTRVGKMYDLHKLALGRGKDSSIFTLRVSTAEMNPTALPKFLRSEHEKNPMTFKAEYGGQWLDSSETYITEAAIRACTDVRWTEGEDPKPLPETARLNLTVFSPSCIGRQYFWGLDMAFLHDATALAIGHLEHVGGKNPLLLVYDYIDRMMVGERFEGPGVEHPPGVEKYRGYKALPLEDIVWWLRALNRVMPCFRGATDQHGGQQIVQLLEINEIYNIELVNLTTSINSQMAFALKGYMDNTRCRFPYVPKFMEELRQVEAEYVGGGGYQIRVQAPAEKGATDDMVDAAQEVAYVAQKWLVEEGGLHVDPSGVSLAIQERAQRPPAPILSLDGVPMAELRVLERLRRVQAGMTMAPGTVPVGDPFRRRPRARFR